VRIVNVSPTPPRYDFLDPSGTRFERFGVDVRPEDLADRQAVIILDLSSWSQLAEMADFVRDFQGERVVIDHHVSQDDLGALVLKDTTAEATGTLVLEAARSLGVKPDVAAATGLLTAIAMDTGWFRHPSAKPSTMRDAAELVEAGASLSDVYRSLFERSTLGRLKLIGTVLSRLQLAHGGRLAFGTVSREDFENSGAIPPDTEDIIDQIASIKGVEVAMLFIEQFKGGLKLSLRSRAGFDCAELAGRFGGGGHKAAAGVNLPDPMGEQVEKMVGLAIGAMG
jgi:phosphoesterase RecJ-like protein